jgi:hypothetical protein
VCITLQLSVLKCYSCANKSDIKREIELGEGRRERRIQIPDFGNHKSWSILLLLDMNG